MSGKFLLVNFITLLRVIGAFLLFPIYLNYGFLGLGIAVFIFISTDFIDGFLARTLKVSTFFGAAFDALSDKLFYIIVFIILISKKPIMAIVLLMEMGIFFIGTSSAIKGNVSRTTILGKIKTIVIFISLVVLFVLFDYSKLISMYNLNEFDTSLIINILMIVMIVIEFITLIDYIVDYIKNSKNNKSVGNYMNKEFFLKKEWKEALFSHDYYINNKDVAISNMVLKNKN
ncbi:MAG: CDP-alcohol phosphatidyltransferase family protein [Bacilli bacterium]|nr:CDP-alcohol phosphatidyltransferase family protein [Bacilli bacterium]